MEILIISMIVALASSFALALLNKWGKSGKVYPTKQQAEQQGRAIYASGYKGK